MDNQTIVSKMNSYLHESATALVTWLDDILPRVADTWWDDCVLNSLSYKSPAIYATILKPEVHKRDIWDAETLFRALEVCEDDRLKLAINLAFACSMRIGEILGLTWDCIDISPESIKAGKAFVYINKELQRVVFDIQKAACLSDKRLKSYKPVCGAQ